MKIKAEGNLVILKAMIETLAFLLLTTRRSTLGT
jgi:hypothetical protein